ncbi:MAG TPA: glycosyl hydrolase family 18 protein [Acidimicrobiales bacterium]
MAGPARRRTPIGLLALLGALAVSAAAVGAVDGSPGSTHHTSLAVGPRHHHHRGQVRGTAGAAATAAGVGNRIDQLGVKPVSLPAATSAPVAATPAVLLSPPLAAREDFAFAPYWTLGQSPTFDLEGLSTLAYFSVGVNPDGTLDESGPGWNGYESQDLVALITRAHALGERVVLTVNDFGQSSLDQLTSSATAPTTLAAALIPVLQAKSLDGVNFDFEGQGSGDQAGLTHLMAVVSSTLRAADPHWQITMDTYASSAGAPGGFYNLAALAPSVDAFFVMAYELNLSGTASATSPLTSTMFSDLTTLEQYTAAVPASKVILGTPFFGIDWPTNNGTLLAKATGAAADIADAQVQSDPLYWDPVTESGWTSYQAAGGQWHESFFESPYALYQVAKLVSQYAVRGVGIWALGMEDDGPQMVAALDGFAPSAGPGGNGPAATTASPSAATTTTTTPAHTTPSTSAPTTSTTGSTTITPNSTTTTTPLTFTATYEGKTLPLTSAPQGGADMLDAAGTVTDFETNDPALSCLNGKTLNVYGFGLLSSKLVAVATEPADCANWQFTFSG